MDDLRRQLQVNAEQAALEPLRAAHSSVMATLEESADPHRVVDLAGKVLVTLEQMADDVKHERTVAITKILETEGGSLAPLADEVDVQVGRSRRRRRET